MDFSHEQTCPQRTEVLRLSLIHISRSLVELSPREERPLKEYHKDVMKNVMMPAMARGAHVKVEKRTEALRRWAETAPINTVEYNDKRIGIICVGTTYTYAKEALEMCIRDRSRAA